MNPFLGIEGGELVSIRDTFIRRRNALGACGRGAYDELFAQLDAAADVLPMPEVEGRVAAERIHPGPNDPDDRIEYALVETPRAGRIRAEWGHVIVRFEFMTDGSTAIAMLAETVWRHDGFGTTAEAPCSVVGVPYSEALAEARARADADARAWMKVRRESFDWESLGA